MSYDEDVRKVKRQQMLAQMLQQQGQQAMQGSQGRHFVAPSKTAGILGALQQAAGGYLGGKSMEQMGTLEDQRKKQLADQLAKMAGLQTAPQAQASVEPTAPVMGMKAPLVSSSGVDPRREQMAAALQTISGLPVEQQETILGSQAMLQLFPSAKEGFTLGPGQRRFDASGREVATAPIDGKSLFGRVQPNDFTPESLRKFQETGDYSVLKPTAGGSNIGKFNPGDYTPESFSKFMQSGKPEDLHRYVTPANPTVQVVGGIPTVVQPSRTGAAPTQQPLTTLPEEIASQSAIKQGITTATAIGEAQAAQAAKAPATASMDYVIDQFDSVGSDGKPAGILNEAMQGGMGGVVGKVGSVFDYGDAKRFDNLREQLSTELRTVYRIPGEGTLSDREQVQYGLQLPDRDNPASVNKLILKDLRARTRLRMQTPIGSAPSSPEGNSGPPTIKSDADYDALPSNTEFIDPDGVRRRKP